MTAIDFPDILTTARGLSSASNKLLLISGGANVGKTTLLRRVADTLGWPLVNLGGEVSRALLNLTLRQRRLKAEETVSEVLRKAGSGPLCLDNTEILFDRTLHLNPISLFLNLSRNRVLVPTWNGQLERASMVFAYPGHPEYFKGRASGFPVVTIADEKFFAFLEP